MSRICEQLVRWFSTWYVCASRPTPIVYHCHKPRVKRTWDGPVVGLTYKSGPFNMGGPFIISDSTVPPGIRCARQRCGSGAHPSPAACLQGPINFERTTSVSPSSGSVDQLLAQFSWNSRTRLPAPPSPLGLGPPPQPVSASASASASRTDWLGDRPSSAGVRASTSTVRRGVEAGRRGGGGSLSS